MNRITKADMSQALSRYMNALMSLNITKPGHRMEYRKGSKAYGNSYKLVWVEEGSGGLSPVPGADFGGHVGSTQREAYDAIHNMARTLEDVAFWQYENKA